MTIEADQTAHNLIATYLTSDADTLYNTIRAVIKDKHLTAQVFDTLATIARVHDQEPRGFVHIPELGLPPDLILDATEFALAYVKLDVIKAAYILDMMCGQPEETHSKVVATVLYILVGIAANAVEEVKC